MEKLAEPKPKPGTKQKIRLFPPVPKGFDPLKASEKELHHYGLPLRPNAFREPSLTALWDRFIVRYRDYEHLEAKLTHFSPQLEPPLEVAFGLFPGESCG